MFKNNTGKVIYVGKAKNLKNRVSSYFHSPQSLGPKTKILVDNISSLDHIIVGSEIEALLLESRLIKKFKPHFNLISKDDKSPYYIHITNEKFPRPVVTHQTQNSLAGPFLNGLIPRRILGYFRHVTPYCTARRPVKKPCFYSHLGLCSPCPGQIGAEQISDRYQLNIQRLKRLLMGQFESVRKQLKTDMIKSSKNHDFETAAKLRDQISAIEHLKIRPILPDEYLQNPNLATDVHSLSIRSLQDLLNSLGLQLSNLNRIEMYDNAHLSGTAATSGMVVATNGELDRSQYRHFRIKQSNSKSDVSMMAEILSRRQKHTEWPHPNLIVLDGGIAQLSSVSHLQFSCPVIALSKRFETVIISEKFGKYREINPPNNHPGLMLLQSLRNESHRFSRRLHHKTTKQLTFS